MSCRRSPAMVLVLTLVVVLGCSSDPPSIVTPPTPPPTPVSTVTVTGGQGQILVGETSQFLATLRDAAGDTLTGRAVTWTSSDTTVVALDSIGLAGVNLCRSILCKVIAVGSGAATITATAEGQQGNASIAVIQVIVRITSGPTAFVRGDVVRFTAQVTDSAGAVFPGDNIRWSVLGVSGLFDRDGQFVAYDTGQISVVARSGSAVADTLAVTVSDRPLTGSFTVVGPGVTASSERTSDLWVNRNVLYSGTFSGGNGAFYAWSIANPTNPVLTDSIFIDASVVNDVKIRGDGTLAVITHEGSSDGLNGVTLLDMTDPHHPTVITRYTPGLLGGVHNAWIDGNHLYVVSPGLSILDISDPANPTRVGSFFGVPAHDVYVRGGLAFLSTYGDGLTVLDVGDGRAGGSPSNPVQVGQLVIPRVFHHNTWYWPAAGYAFVGDEVGVMHVVDVSNMSARRQVATFGGASPHNFWLDESRGILYAAWSSLGIRAIDVNGQLMGQLEQQGREIAILAYSGASMFGWSPQLHNGYIYLSDIFSGVWVLQPNF